MKNRRDFLRLIPFNMTCGLLSELDDSSEESDDDDDNVGGRRGRTAHHTFAPLGSQASGPPASGRGRSSRKMAPASAAMEESSSERLLNSDETFLKFVNTDDYKR